MRRCEKWDGNVRNQCEYAGNLGENVDNAENQCGNAGNQGGHLGIAVGMTQDSSGNDKSKCGEKSK